MRIELRNLAGKRIGHVEAEASARPARVSLVPTSAHTEKADVYLRWDEAIDDAGALRRCVICGCDELYVRKNMPQVTPFIILLAFIGAVVAALGLANHPAAIVLLILLLVVDVATLFVARRRLHCYRCRATYLGAHIARYMRPWDRAIAERMRLARPEEFEPLPTVITGAVPMQPSTKDSV
ncbi:MAG: hypothetical protein EXS10_07805 [Phycisphaerales bacterium]|nr:hypothetical protein [Phycisphaerales bacterium]